MKKSVNLISLGCSKNLVDSERLLKMLESEGFEARFESQADADVVVVNTCGFIGDAKEESINTILHWADRKNRGEISTLAVMGCLSQRYADELRKEIPEVDFWTGKLNWHEIVGFLTKHSREATDDRILTTPPHYTYVKIAEGCNRFCAFCAIPLITGRLTSRPIEAILNEVAALVDKGVREFNIIAQDLTDYGKDIYGECRLPELIDRMSDIEGVKWIRLHYLYPFEFPYEILDVMARKPNVCKYIDIALQHISDPVLTNMRRHISADETRKLLDTIRRHVPGIHLRTTLMVGFPGEGEKEFTELLDFVKEQKFERMGAFAYCEEEGTYAATHYEDAIPEETKQRRLDELMALQERISLDLQEQKVGSETEVVIDAVEGDYFVCRTEYDSPDVDPVVMVPLDDSHRVGQFCKVRVVSAEPFELTGTFID